MGTLQYTTEDMKALAKECGLKFISKEYTGIVKKHKWRCPAGHEWEATPNSIKCGNRCKKCSSSKLRTSIKDAYKVAEDCGFEFVSKEYTGTKKKHKWMCRNGHIWITTLERIKRGSQCPQCNSRLNEEKVRFVFEELFQDKFPKTREVLDGLELDGYCKNLKLAFEYQGEQHYNSQHYWNVKHSYEEQVNRDLIKSRKCAMLNIIKIDVPHYESNNIFEYIKSELHSRNIYTINQCVDWSRFKGTQSKLTALQKLAKSKQGELISDQYFGSHQKHEWKCLKCNKTWISRAKDVAEGSWCPWCANNIKYTKDKIIDMCKGRGFCFKSKSYEGMLAKHDVICVECNFPWNVKINRIQQGAKCPNCGKGGK